MPITLHQFNGAMGPGHAQARTLAKLCVDQYMLNIEPGPGGGIAEASCWAAVAVEPHAALGYRAERQPNAAGPVGSVIPGGAAEAYSAVFGNSRMAAIAAHVAVPGAPAAGFSSHAERNALISVPDPVQLYFLPGAAGNAVMFVQLSPCDGCMAWLTGGGGGRANPFGVAIAAGLVTLHIWYRWPYPAGIDAMTAFNQQTRGNQLAAINAW